MDKPGITLDMLIKNADLAKIFLSLRAKNFYKVCLKSLSTHKQGQIL